MSNQANRNPAPGREAQALVSTPDTEVALDANGFDPAAYDWIPVLRRPRADGWTQPRQRLFIEVLADTASPKQAADAVGLTRSSAYKLRRSPGGEAFAAAWDAAIQQGSKRLVDIAYERAVDGVEEPVRDRDGTVIGHRTRYNDRLLMFLLRAHQPDRYRHAGRDTRRADEIAPPTLPPVAQAVAALGPVVPDEPHALMEPDELEDKLLVADLCEGELPDWHKPKRPEPERKPDPRDAEIDRKLDEIRRANNPGWDPSRFIVDEEEEAAEAEEAARLRGNRRARRAAAAGRARRSGRVL